MSKIFVILSIVSLLLLAIAMGFGLRVGDYNEAYTQLLRGQKTLNAERDSLSAADVKSREQELEALFTGLEAPQSRARTHILIGILASLVGLLVNSVSVTYFIGTSRWCKEVVETYQLDSAFIQDSARLKRRCFPCALSGMLLMLLIVALGAASDPGTLRASTGSWVLPHFTAALAGTALLAGLFALQFHLISQNTQLVERVLGVVRKIRQERGMDTV